MVTGCHLVVLCHGLWGIPEHFDYLESVLKESNETSNVVYYRTKSNERYRTYDGIDLCGARVAEEILEETARLETDGNPVIRFSIVGYSLGGLVSRYAIGVLEFKGYFDQIEPVNFTSICSPNVGVLTPGDSISIKAFNWLVPRLLANSGRQMFLKDDVFKSKDHQKVPLLSLMASPKSVFYRALANFNNLALYSNIRSDIRTSWWTSGISYINPFQILDSNPNVTIDDNGYMAFEDGSKFELSFLKGYSPIILDVNGTITFDGASGGSAKTSSSTIAQMVQEDTPQDNDLSAQAAAATSNFVARKLKWVTLLFRVGIYLPLWVLWFILYNLLQSFQSGIRVVRESPKVNEFVNTTRLDELSENAPTAKMSRLENEVQDQGDYFLDSVFDAVTSPTDANKSIFHYDSKVHWTTTLWKLCSTSPTDLSDPGYHEILKHFDLGLSKEQCEIVKNLNRLPWKKFPLYITGTNATHAAAIVRHPDPAFKQGKVVMHHYAYNVFQA